MAELSELRQRPKESHKESRKINSSKDLEVGSNHKGR